MNYILVEPVDQSLILSRINLATHWSQFQALYVITAKPNYNP